MFNLTIKELAARKLRLLTTAFAVLLGVAFMSGTFIFTDTIGATFDSALADVDAGVDAYVRAPSDIDTGYGQGPRLDASITDTIAAVDGVDQVALRLNGYARLVGPDGTPVGDVAQNPAFGMNWVTADNLNPWVLATGSAPANDDEIVIDQTSANLSGYQPGDVATVLTKQTPREFTISGIARFGELDSPAGATAVLFTDTTAAEMLVAPGEANAIAVTADDGVTQSTIAAAVAAALDSDVEVITGTALIAENQASLAADFAAFKTILLVFALVAMFVGAFIINNTFSITVAQRTREMALLRAIGASGRQVKLSVLIEAAIVGVLASAAGLAAGVGVATGLAKLMSQFGIEIPDGPMAISSSALAVSFAAGVAVTTLSAWLPARRAAKIAPIDAMRSVSVDDSAGSTRRTTLGAVVTTGGVGAVLIGLAVDQITIVGAGALVTFTGVAILGPVLARPVAHLLGVPLRLRGVSGEIATRNAMRSPKRTARTAASLMIGVALVGFITVVAASTKTSIAASLDEEFVGTHIIGDGGWDNTTGLSPQLAERLRDQPGIDVVSQTRNAPAVVNGTPTDMFFAFDATTIDAIFQLGAIDGDLGSLGSDGIAVSADEAAANAWTLGSSVPVTFIGGNTTFTVEAIYTSGTDWVGTSFVDIDAFTANGLDELDYRIYVSGDTAAITTVTAADPSAVVQDRAAFIDGKNADIDMMLGLFYVMLALAVFIALLGIANTLALSICERTRELGLMRAVGMTRAQTRSMVRWEATIIAVFGSTLGLIIGTFFGWAVVHALADRGIDTLTVPITSLAVVTLIAAAAGAAAAIMPARRAARLDVLTALVSE
jgi:putative ABC transport system permease protein